MILFPRASSTILRILMRSLHYFPSQLATRRWQLATRNCNLQRATRNSQLATRNSQLAIRNSQLATRNSQLATRILPTPIFHRHWQPAAGNLQLAIALFTVNFSHLHYNVFEYGCEAISGRNCKIVRNCLASTFKNIVMQMRKGNCEKGYCNSQLATRNSQFATRNSQLHSSYSSQIPY